MRLRKSAIKGGTPEASSIKNQEIKSGIFALSDTADSQPFQAGKPMYFQHEGCKLQWSAKESGRCSGRRFLAKSFQAIIRILCTASCGAAFGPGCAGRLSHILCFGSLPGFSRRDHREQTGGGRPYQLFINSFCLYLFIILYYGSTYLHNPSAHMRPTKMV
jgi:hypothetical protein